MLAVSHVPPILSTRADRHVFQIGSGWYPEVKGGAESVFFNLFQALPGEGFDVRGIVPGSDAVENVTGGRIRGFGADGVSLVRRASSIRRSALASFSAVRPNLIASHFALYALPLLDRLRDIPLVVHFHGPWALESRLEGANSAVAATKKAIERIVYRRAERIIVLSHAFGRLLQRQYGVPEAMLRLVPGGVNCARFSLDITRTEARDVLGWSVDRPILFAVRRLVRRMGLENLIEAMALLRRSHPDALLFIAGSGPERRSLEELVVRRNLGGSVRFAGFMPDHLLPLAYRAADISVVPSVGLEGFGLIAVESLAAGTPVLVTPVDGLPEVVSGLSEALIMPGTEPAAMAEGLSWALANPSALPAEAACRAYAKTAHDWRIIAARTASVYKELL